MAVSFATEIPPYWSPARDVWLRNFYKKPGNDLLAGTISTVISKVETTGWYVEGPERMANMYQRILMREAEFGAGWSIFCQKAVLPYLTQDNGMWIERRRSGATDREGAALGFANFDSAMITPSADPANPAWFLDDENNYHKLHFSQVGHIVDMPSDDHKMNNVGYCALSRAAMTARILMMIAKYKYERLSDLPPAGLLILNNLTEGQWKDMQEKYTAGEMNKNNSTWRNIMVAFGLDPSLKAEAALFEFSRLPEHFDEAKATEIAVYSFALAFNIDPGDVWPRSNTPLGTATDANISHLKAKGKRIGAIYADLERFFNDGFSLPKTCLFAFDYKDTDEDMQAAEIANLRAQLIRKLWEPPANAKLGFGTAPTAPEEAAPNPETQEGIITRDEARAMAVLSGIAPDWLLKTNATQMSISDTGIEKSGIDMGPRSRVYRSGLVLRLEHRPQVWNGFTRKALTTDAVVRALKDSEYQEVIKFNPNHEPAGSPEGGQFASGEGDGGGGTSSNDGGDDNGNGQKLSDSLPKHSADDDEGVIQDTADEMLDRLQEEYPDQFNEDSQEFVRDALYDWSQDNNLGKSKYFQLAASKEFDVALSDYSNKVLGEQAATFSANSYRAILKDSYSETQAWLDKQAIGGDDLVTLYRGSESNYINSLNSWTPDVKIAEFYAKRNSTAKNQAKIYKLTVPAKYIVGTSKTGLGLPSAKEFVVLGKYTRNDITTLRRGRKRK